MRCAAVTDATPLPAHAARQAAYHLLLCCYALGDGEGMRAAFSRLIACGELPPEGDDGSDDDEAGASDDVGAGASDDFGGGHSGWGAASGGGGGGSSSRGGDPLRDDERRKHALVQE